MNVQIDVKADDVGKSHFEQFKSANLWKFYLALAHQEVCVWSYDFLTETYECQETVFKLHGVSSRNPHKWSTILDSYTDSARSRLEGAIYDGIYSSKNWDLILPIPKSNGRNIWMRSLGVVVSSPNGSKELIGTFQNVSYFKKTENELQDFAASLVEKTEQLNMVLEHMNEGVSVFNKNAELILWNKKYIEIFNKNPDDIYEGVLFEKILEKEKETGEFIGSIPRYIQNLKIQLLSGNTVKAKFKLSNGRTISAVHAPIGASGGWVGTHTDITQQIAIAKHDEYLANHDYLTKLASRSKLQSHFASLIHNTETDIAAIAVILIDLDRFKVVNDQFGHEVGDKLLIAVADRIRCCTRDTDLAARLGGDEIAILVNDKQKSGKKLIVEIVERIISSLELPFNIEDREIYIGASAGISRATVTSKSLSELIKEADQALYKIKENTRGGYRFFDEDIAYDTSAEKHKKSAVRIASQEMDFHLNYQPIIEFERPQVCGFEALIRWNSKGQYNLEPYEIISIAEKSGYMSKIGEWVLNTSIQEAASWKENTWLSVNVSPKQLGDGVFVKQVEYALKNCKFDPSRLELEITENVFLDGNSNWMDELHNLRRMGVKIVLDDFGTGYASLSYLQKFPFHKVKLDRSFTSEMQDHANSSSIVRMVSSLAKELKIASLAEGVETHEQMSLVRKHGYTQAQGFYIGEPSPKAICTMPTAY